MEKKTIVSMGILIAVTAAFLWMNQPSETKVNSQQSNTMIQKKPTTEPSPQSAVPNDVEEACKSAAERFVRVKSEGRSSDIFLDRIEPVKELLSDDLYQSLVQRYRTYASSQTRPNPSINVSISRWIF